MVNTAHDETSDWFYIRSIATGHVISAEQGTLDTQAKSNSFVYVHSQTYKDEELWRWNDQRLVNKATGRVLEIFQEQIRLLEDTEIILNDFKHNQDATHQQWGIKHDEPDTLGRPRSGYIIYSHRKLDWVIDIQISNIDVRPKLILFPYQNIDNDNQRWEFVPANASHPQTSIATSVGEMKINDETVHVNPQDKFTPSVPEFAYALSPAKRGSQSPVISYPISTFKEAHENVYINNTTQVSDKTLAMAVAYEIWNIWNTKQGSTPAEHRSRYQSVRANTCAHLQALARAEAIAILDNADSLTNNKETVLTLTSRLIGQLHDQSK